MSNSETLTKLLTDAPEDDITAYLLADALMEDRDMSRSEATRIVLQVRLAGYDARDLAAAAALIHADAAERSVCLSLIFAACRNAPARSANIILVPGDTGPRSTSAYRNSASGWWYDWTVTVGAAWLTDAYAANVAKIVAMQLRAERRDRRK